MFNHAHFSFGFGPSVSDLIANTTEAFRELSAKYRFARRTARLIGVAGLAPMHRQPVDKRAAKAALGLSPDAPMVLSIGNEAYYSPANGYDFFRTAEKLLAASPDVTLIVVGVRQVSPLVPDGLRAHPRCRWAGPVLDPVPYYEAADLCLESFPMPSLGAVGEAVVYGEAFPIPVYGKGENFLRVSQAPVLDYSFRPADEAEYVAYITELLAQLTIRRAEAHDLRLAMVELDDRWSDELASFNRTVDACRHAPAEIPVCPCLAIEECEVIAGLSAIDLGARIDTVLPFGIAVRAHVDAVRAGLSRPRALGRVGRLAWQGVQRKVAQSTRMGGSVDW
jgi:hypothetical protein